MSDLSVSSTPASAHQSQWAQRKNLFDQLGQALQKGDLKGAQTAFAALQANAPQGAPPQGAQGNATPSPFAALATALQNGDLSAAQAAYAQIQQTRGHHNHRGAQGANGAPPASAGSADNDGDHDGSRSGSSVNLTA
jgi:outer membrane protein assembly factor BamD (BamD/ComL family)